MYNCDPDFEAMKAVTRFMWMLDMEPPAVGNRREPAIASPARRLVA